MLGSHDPSVTVNMSKYRERIQGRFSLRRKEKRLLPLTLVWFL
jgi:hypothetical protein